MNIVPQTKTIDDAPLDQEQFWKEHAKRQRESGNSRVAYCRKHQLNYNQFGYWEQKWRHQAASTSSRLLPVHLNRMSKITTPPQPDTLCTVTFKNGHELKIHDKTVLPILLSLWS